MVDSSYCRGMPYQSKHLRQRRLPDLLPFVIAGASILAVLLSWLLFSLAAQIAVTGILCGGLFGLAVASHIRVKTASRWEPSLLETPFLLAHDPDVFQQYATLCESLLKVSQRDDLIFRSIALEHVDDLSRRAAAIAEGTFVFEGTETWRIVYGRLLRSPGLHLYRSVAWVKNKNYWQDEPGRKSMAVNFELHDQERLNVERIAIIADDLWPAGEVWPAESIRQWLHEQHAHGIWIKFVRQSAIEKELELVADIGIYGSRALGIQELDEQCRTVRFTLSFDFEQVTAAEARWDRLSVYAESFASYLDRYEMPG